MTDKKTFGAFIKSKRIEKNYSQKDLAELLFVTVGAVSKWERGITYPDITLISDICTALDISEHEFITATTDTKTRKIEYEAKKFRIIRNTWFLVPTISYAVALLTCFICNLAVNGTLSWFFIVLSSLICAYTFIPNITYFFKTKKFLVFTVSTYISICLLLFTCAIYTNGLSWFLTACIGVLIGYTVIFLPIILSKTNVSRFKFIISFASMYLLTVLLLFNIHFWHPFNLLSAVLITTYSFFPLIICTVICLFRFNSFFKTGFCIFISSIFYYFSGYIVNILFGATENHYQVDFKNWQQCLNGNINFICLLSLLLISIVFVVIGIIITRKNRKPT